MTYEIHFQGELMPGFSRVAVAERLRHRMKLDDAQLEKLFSGKAVRIKSGLERDAAARLAARFRDLGARVEVTPPLDPVSGPGEPHTSPAQDATPYRAPQSQAETGAGRKYCASCGHEEPEHSRVCSGCGARLPIYKKKDKYAAAVLAFFTGFLGLHRFYLGQWWGIFYILFSPLSWLVSVIESLVFLFTPRERWDARYGAVQGSGATAVVAVVAVVFGIMVIGILAAVAIPAYQDYVARTVVASAMQESRPYRQQMEAFVERTGFIPGTNVDMGLDRNLSSEHITSLRVSEGGVLTLTLTGHPAVDGRQLIWMPDFSADPVAWECRAEGLSRGALPTQCRSPSNDYGTPGPAADPMVRVSSADGRGSIRIPRSWRPMEMGADASMSYTDQLQDIGIVVVREPHSDFAGTPDLADYTQMVMDYSFPGYTDLLFEDRGERLINGYPAMLFNVEGDVQRLRIKALVATVDTGKTFYKITGYTRKSRFAAEEYLIEEIVTSFEARDSDPATGISGQP